MIAHDEFVGLVRTGDAERVEKEINAIPRNERSAFVNRQTERGELALFVAADCGHERVVELLLKARARADIALWSGLGFLDFTFKPLIKTMLRQAGAFSRRDVEKSFAPPARSYNQRRERELERVRRSHARARR